MRAERSTRARSFALVLAISALQATGCSLGELGLFQLRLINDQKRLDRAIAREPDPERRALLAEVPRVRRFGEEVMSLRPGNSYTGYFATEREAMTYVLTASEKLRLRAYSWWFPIAGRIEYRSYYDEADAREAADALEARGYDTWVGRSRAYSTLGIFRDPVTTTMLRDGLPGLVEVLLHELTHARTYVPGHTAWNEALATFVGEHGAEQYFARARFAGSAWPERMREHARRKHALDALTAGAYERLSRLYASGRPMAAILSERERVFGELSREVSRLYPDEDPSEWRMNNARLVHFHRYSASSERFVALWNASGGRWRQFFAGVDREAHGLAAEPGPEVP